MAKRIIAHTFIGLALLTASCTQDTPETRPDDTGKGRIEFKASLPGITSRATEVTGATLEKIRVSCFTIGASSVAPYFLDKTFSKSATDRFISYDPECIWPNNDDKLRFVAFSPSCEAMREAGGFGDDCFVLPTLTTGEAMASDEYKLSGFHVADDIARQTDFITATNSGRLLDDEDDGVRLAFHHQLSRIRLRAWGVSKSYSLEIAGVRIGGVGVGGDFIFTASPTGSDATESGMWSAVNKGKVDYIFREGDKIVALDNADGSPSSAEKAVSIMGAKIGGDDGYDNSAMLLPSAYTAWDYVANKANADSEGHTAGMYFSVLVRVTDTTPFNPGKIAYPYDTEASDGMELVYLAVDRESGIDVKARLYRKGEEYFTDAACTLKYDIEENAAEIKAFGWAALPVGDEWLPGYIYTYTLNYSNGVGLHDPDDANPGEPIISDKVIVNVEVADWQHGADKDVEVPRK